MRRYPRYKNSGVTWLGDIPEGWEVSKFRAALRERREKYSRNEELMILSLLKDVGVVPYSEKGNIGNRAKEDLSQYKVARTGDFIINSMNVIIGSLGVSQYDGYISPAYYSFEPRKFVSVQYISYLCSLRKVQKAIRCYAKGIMEIRLRVSAYDFLSMSIPLPPLPEQEAIVRYLDETTGKIDKAIAAEERLIELLQERKQIIINEAVGGNLSHAEAQRGRGWVVKPFKSLFSTCNGLTITKTDLSEEGCSVLSYGQIHSKKNNGIRVNPELVRHVPESFAKAKSLAHKGDFLFADTSEDLEGCGNCIFIDMEEPIYAGAHVILAKANHSENGYYLAYEFASVNWRSQLRMKVNGVKVFSVTQTILNSVSVALPPLPEQEAIVKYLDEETGKIDKAIDVKRRQIALLRERREIIIDEVVTGKVKVA